MPNSQQDLKEINTGGGAFIGGNVSIDGDNPPKRISLQGDGNIISTQQGNPVHITKPIIENIETGIDNNKKRLHPARKWLICAAIFIAILVILIAVTVVLFFIFAPAIVIVVAIILGLLMLFFFARIIYRGIKAENKHS